MSVVPAGANEQSNAQAALDRPAPKQSATWPAARQRPLRDAENFGGGVSWVQPPRRRTVNTEPLAGSLVTRHVAAPHARELSGDGKPQPGAAAVLRRRVIGPTQISNNV